MLPIAMVLSVHVIFWKSNLLPVSRPMHTEWEMLSALICSMLIPAIRWIAPLLSVWLPSGKNNLMAIEMMQNIEEWRKVKRHSHLYSHWRKRIISCGLFKLFTMKWLECELRRETRNKFHLIILIMKLNFLNNNTTKNRYRTIQLCTEPTK